MLDTLDRRFHVPPAGSSTDLSHYNRPNRISIGLLSAGALHLPRAARPTTGLSKNCPL